MRDKIVPRARTRAGLKQKAADLLSCTVRSSGGPLNRQAVAAGCAQIVYRLLRLYLLYADADRVTMTPGAPSRCHLAVPRGLVGLTTARRGVLSGRHGGDLGVGARRYRERVLPR